MFEGIARIKCCRYCVPPKRKPGCACEEYLQEKKELEILKTEYKNKCKSAIVASTFREENRIKNGRKKRTGKWSG